MKKEPKAKRLWKPSLLVLAAMSIDIALIFWPSGKEAVIPKKPEIVLVVQSLEES